MNTMASITLSLMTGVVTGLVSGLYSCIITARYVRFADLRGECLRTIRAIDFIESDSALKVLNDETLPYLASIASDLFALGHIVAGERVATLRIDMLNAISSARADRLSVAEFNERYMQWQVSARELPARKAVLWSIFRQL